MKNTKENQVMLFEQVRQMPENPGVYLMKNIKNDIIYIGKAKNLKNRVKSYFSSSIEKESKTAYLVKKINSIEIITTDTEYEAMILENNLIKKWKPKYNISLKDCKTFPVIKITKEDFPRVYRTRKISDDGALYFGPFPAVHSMDMYLELIYKKFKIRKCRGTLRKRKHPCLYYHIGQCGAPCAGKADKADYNREVKQIIGLLSGKTDSLLKELEKKMKKAAALFDYEEAAEYRDFISSVKDITEEQKVQDFNNEKRDFIAMICKDSTCSFVVLQMRSGKLSGKSVYLFTSLSSSQENMTKFLIQYYTESASDIHIPDSVFVNLLPETELIDKYFIDNNISSLKITLPGEKRELSILKMAEENCRIELLKDEKEKKTALALKELKEKLGLKKLPVRIEGFDIAHLEGKYTVASMVSFYNGKPDKTSYRLFHIRSAEHRSSDDYSAIREAVGRRYTRVINDNLVKPDLILIDGGRGQLNAAKGILDSIGLDDINTVSIAKQEELLFIPDNMSPVKLPETSEGLRILQYVRDEAHRFATAFNKNLRGKEISFTFLEKIPGIGKERSRKLMKEFGSIENLKKTDIYTIAEKTGFPQKVAENIADYLKKTDYAERKEG